MTGSPPIPRPVIDRPEVRNLCERLVPGVIPRRIQVVEPPPGAQRSTPSRAASFSTASTMQGGWRSRPTT